MNLNKNIYFWLSGLLVDEQELLSGCSLKIRVIVVVNDLSRR